MRGWVLYSSVLIWNDSLKYEYCILCENIIKSKPMTSPRLDDSQAGWDDGYGASVLEIVSP